MKLLYVTDINTTLTEIYLVSDMIKAQSQFDEVCWVNLQGNVNSILVDVTIPCFFGEKCKRIHLSTIEKEFGIPDLVIFHNYTDNLLFLSLIYELIDNSIPYIIASKGSVHIDKVIHNIYSNYLKEQLEFKKMFFNRALAIQHLSEQNQLSSDVSNSSLIIPNSIKRKPYIKRNYKNSINALFVGNSSDKNDLDLVLNAIGKIRSELRKKNFHFTIYTDTSNQDNRNIQMTYIIDRDKLFDIVKIVPTVYGKEKLKVLKQSDLAILVSRNEETDLLLLNYLSYSLPVFITNKSNLSKEVENYGAGYCCYEKNMEFKLLQMVNNFENEHEFMNKNAHRLSLNYDCNIIAERTHIEYEKILKKRE